MNHITTIGLVSGRIDGSAHSSILVGVHAAVRQAGARLIVLCGFPKDTTAPTLAADQIDGWLAIPSGVDPPQIRAIAATGKPLVTIDAVHPDLCPGVMCDNRSGMYAAIQHLIAHGHRRIAFVNFSAHPPMQACCDGYQDALAEAGIPFDPALVHDVTSWTDELGPAVQRWLALDSPCTAIATGVDSYALSAIEAVQQAGYCVPDDIAVTGFDDYEFAQHTTPALTSVRKPFAEIGRRAAQLVLAQIAGQNVAPGAVLLPGILVARRSCGCGLTSLLPSPGADECAADPTEWQTDLAAQIVALVHYPLPLDTALEPRQVWPGSAALIAGLSAALRGEVGPSVEKLEHAWRQLPTMRTELAACNEVLTLLERAGAQQLAASNGDSAAAARVERFLTQARLQMQRASYATMLERMNYLDNMVRNTHAISMSVSEEGTSADWQLTWLRTTPMNWGCMGLWDEEQAGDAARTLVVSATYRREGTTGVSLGQRYRPTAFPPTALLPAATCGGGPDIVVLLPITTASRDWGVLALAGPVIRELTALKITFPITTIWTTMMGAALERTALVESLAKQHALLQATNQELSLAKEAAEEANHLKTRFLANMSHELRTPLNAILNFTRFLGKPRYGTLTERQLELQTRVLSNADHLLGLINDILDLSKIEAGRMDLFLEQTDLLPLLRGVMATTIGLTKDKGIELSLDLPEMLPPVMIDRTRIRQVLLNLLSNAAKFTDRGGISVRAYIDQRPAPIENRGLKIEDSNVGGDEMRSSILYPLSSAQASFVVVEVQDSGIGITPENQALVFEEFRQVQDDLTRQYQGTGLGLPISKRLVEMHGGTIWLESTPAVGSTFRFTLPISQPVPAAETQPAELSGADQAVSVVLVDDDPNAQEIVR